MLSYPQFHLPCGGGFPSAANPREPSHQKVHLRSRATQHPTRVWAGAVTALPVLRSAFYVSSLWFLLPSSRALSQHGRNPAPSLESGTTRGRGNQMSPARPVSTLRYQVMLGFLRRDQLPAPLLPSIPADTTGTNKSPSRTLPRFLIQEFIIKIKSVDVESHQVFSSL